MGPKREKRVRKKEFPKQTPAEFDLGIQLLIYRGEEKRGTQEKMKKRHRNKGRKPGRKQNTQQRRE